MIKKPYFRIYRPNKNNGDSRYILEDEYCLERSDLIKYYNFLQKQVIELFDYIEPSKNNLKTYSSKNYQLLTNISMEVENNLKGIINANTYNSNGYLKMEDYKKLDKYMHLSEYKVVLKFNKEKIEFSPYTNFKTNKVLEWYQDYNSIKHDRTNEVKKATLENVLKALGGLYILLRAQFVGYISCINNSTSSITYIELQNGVYNPYNAIPIFEISKGPTWLEKEKYNIDWDILKNGKNRYQKLNII